MKGTKLQDYAAKAADMKPEDFRWWKPSEDESITGTIEFIGEKDGAYGVQRVIKLRDAEDVLWCKAFTAAITREAEEKVLRTGDIISIKYFGEQKTKTGNKYQDFRVMVHERGKLDGFKDDIPF